MNTAATATITIELTLEQLRVVAKSLSRTRDAELRKLARLKQGSPVYIDVQRDFKIVDEVDAEVSQALSELALR